MLKIAFNARLLTVPTIRGWNRYTINLLQELASLDVMLFLYSDQPLHPLYLAKLPKGSCQVHISPPTRYVFWEQYWLPRQCEKDRVDILHCPMNFGLPWSSPCPLVLTLHDAIDQVYYAQDRVGQRNLSLANLQSSIYHWVSRHRADHILTVSQHSKQDIIKYLHIPQDKITVIYEAADPVFHRPISHNQRLQIRDKYRLQLPYVLYVGGWEKRKNIPFLINAFAQANLDGIDLVLVGGNGYQRDILTALGESVKISQHLHLLGWVDDDDLPGLYAGAMCFVYPSAYEGFGLQLCEAMAVGCPILAAMATCLPEILGNGGETFSIDETSELVNLLRRLSGDRSYRNHLIAQSKQRNHAFSWQITAQQTKKIYQQF
jgi:glycosyltransferase involved in cell wall biosynthesis